MSTATDLIAACQNYLAEQRTVFTVLASNQSVIEKLSLAVANLDARMSVLEGTSTATAAATPAMYLNSISAVNSSVVHVNMSFVGVPTGSMAYVMYGLAANTATGPWTAALDLTATNGARVVTITGLAASSSYTTRGFLTLGGANVVPMVEAPFNTSAGGTTNANVQTLANTEIQTGPTGGTGLDAGGGGKRVKEGANSTWGTYHPQHIMKASTGYTTQFWTPDWAYSSLGQVDIRLQPWQILAERASAAWGSYQPPNAAHLKCGIAVRNVRGVYYANSSWYPISSAGNLAVDLGEQAYMDMNSGVGRWATDTSRDGSSPRVRQLYNSGTAGVYNNKCNHTGAGTRHLLSAAQISSIQAIVFRMQARVEPLVDLGGTTADASACDYLMQVGCDPYPTDRNASQVPGETDWLSQICGSRFTSIGINWTDAVATEFSTSNTATYISTLPALPAWFLAE